RHRPGHALRGQFQRDRAAQGVAREVGPLQPVQFTEAADRLDQREHVVGFVPGRGGGGPKTRKVHAEDLVLLTESRYHAVPALPSVTESVQQHQGVASTTPFEGDACRIHPSGVPDGSPERAGRTTHSDMIYTAAPVRETRDGASCRFRSGVRVSDSPATTASSPSSVANPVPRPTTVKVRSPL